MIAAPVDEALVPARAAPPAASFPSDVRAGLDGLVRRARRRVVVAGAAIGLALAAGGAAASFDPVVGALVGAALLGPALVVGGRFAAAAARIARRARRLDPMRDVVVVDGGGEPTFFDDAGVLHDGTFRPYVEGDRRWVLAVKDRLGGITLRAERGGERAEPDDLVVRVPPTWTDDDTVRVAAKLAAAANRALPPR